MTRSDQVSFWSSGPGTRFGCAQRPTPSSCSSAAPRWEGRVTSGGTSSHPGQSASSRRRRSGPAVGSTRCQVTWRSSSLCPKHRRSLGALQARFSTLSRPRVVRLSATSQLALLQHHRVRHARRYSPPSPCRRWCRASRCRSSTHRSWCFPEVSWFDGLSGHESGRVTIAGFSQS